MNRTHDALIDDALKFPWRDCVKVALDWKPDAANKPQIVFVVDLKAINPSERPADAAPREQLGLFSEVA